MSDHVYLGIARGEAHQSPDPSTQVGALLKATNGSEVRGHNHFLYLEEPQAAPRDVRYDHVVHAEAHAILRAGHLARAATIYSSHEPCVECVKAAIVAGVARVVFLSTSPERRERWKCDLGRRLAAAAGLAYVEVQREGEAK